jgi:hypothetical protein
MELTNEIQATARQFGQSLRRDEYVRAYLDAEAKFRADPEASALEKKMYLLYEGVIAHEKSEELDGQEDINEFNRMRKQFPEHPLISKRNDIHRMAQPYLDQVAEEISFRLGMDYIFLASRVDDQAAKSG